MTTIDVREGDCVEVLAAMPEHSIDAVVCDPPYGLEFMGKEWDRLDLGDVRQPGDENFQAADPSQPFGRVRHGGTPSYRSRGAAVVDDPADVGGFQDGAGGNPFSRSRIRYGNTSGGGTVQEVNDTEWDGRGDHSFPFGGGGQRVRYGSGGAEMQAWHERWLTEALRVLKPGGWLLAFSGTRTYHRLACAAEDAGFEVRDMIDWLYGCLTADVEVLTEHGWKPGIEVEVGDPIAQWDPTTGAVSLAPVAETFRGPWDGPMRVLRNADTDQVLTPNHRVWHLPRQRAQRDGARTSWYGDEWRVAEAGTLTTWNPVRLPLGGEHDGPGIGGADYAALLGWVWTEGGFDHSGTGVRVYQSSVNPGNVAEIDADVSACGRHKRYDREREYRGRTYTETCWFISGALARDIRADLPGKRPTYALLWRMTLKEKRAFLRAAMLGDGSGWGTHAEQFHQRYEDDLVWFQTLLALVGRAGKVGMRPDRDNGAVYLRRNARTELQARHLADSTEHYTGEVWCVRVPTGAFLARRNGRVFVTGNSGFPKSMDVAKAIDSHLGVDGSFGGPKSEAHAGWIERGRMRAAPGEGYGHEGWDRPGLQDPEAVDRLAREYLPGSEEAAAWQGWGTALKPGHEPILVARKPIERSVAANVLAHGTGALNIDASRIVVPDRAQYEANFVPWQTHERGDDGVMATGSPTGMNRPGRLGVSAVGSGRFPANVILSHDEACVQVGWRDVPTGTAVTRNLPDEGASQGNVPIGPRTQRGPDISYGVDGLEPIEAWECVPGCPVAELDAQSGSSTSADFGTERAGIISDLVRQAPRTGMRTGHGDAGGASRFFYVAKTSTRERNLGLAGFPEVFAPTMGNGIGEREHDPDDPRSYARNHHPTVKPVELMRYLVRMVTPPGGTVCDPFLGSGTTAIACVLEGFGCVGIEREPEYVTIARARIEHAKQSPRSWEADTPPAPKVRTKGDGWEQGALL